MKSLGRPPGSSKIPDAHFANRYRAAFEQLVERDGYSPTQKDIAGALGITAVTLRTQCKRHGITPGSSG